MANKAIKYRVYPTIGQKIMFAKEFIFRMIKKKTDFLIICHIKKE